MISAMWCAVACIRVHIQWVKSTCIWVTEYENFHYTLLPLFCVESIMSGGSASVSSRKWKRHIQWKEVVDKFHPQLPPHFNKDKKKYLFTAHLAVVPTATQCVRGAATHSVHSAAVYSMTGRCAMTMRWLVTCWQQGGKHTRTIWGGSSTKLMTISLW